MTCITGGYRMSRTKLIVLAAMAFLASPAQAKVPAHAADLTAARFSAIDAGIRQGEFGNVDSLLIMQHGKVVFDRAYPHDYVKIYGATAQKPGPLNSSDPGGAYNYYNPWWHPYYRNQGQLHTEQSITKTITSIVVGAAVARGDFPSLDTPVLSFFDASKVRSIDDRKRHMTIRHLLTMSAGVQWNDEVGYDDPANDTSGMEASGDWAAYFINRPMQDEPGTKFYYNDGASAALATIFRRATGHDIEQYAAEHVFGPLGITQWYWKRSPAGTPDTEGGLYFTRRDVAKFMELFQHDGMWNGTRIVSADWVRNSLAPAFAVAGRSDDTSRVKYGYLWWLTPYADNDPRMAFGAHGWGGQTATVMKNYDTVIVINAWDIGAAEPQHDLTQAVKSAIAGLASK